MTAAVIMACSILSLSRMSLISSILFSVIIIIPLHICNANVCFHSIIIEIYRKVNIFRHRIYEQIIT